MVYSPREQEVVRVGTTYGPRYSHYASISKGAYRPDGYISCIYNGKRVLQHRAVWTEHCGNISDDMEIHHINGIKHDNRIENLQMLTIPQHRKHIVKSQLSKLELWSLKEAGLGWKELCALAGVWSHALNYHFEETLHEEII